MEKMNWFVRLKNWFVRRKYNKEHESERKRIVKRPRCRCGSRNFDIGPRGGLSINIRCKKCGKEYNIVRIFNIGYLMEEI